MLSNDGQLDYFQDQNAILLRDTKPVLDEIEQFIERMDTEPVQVYIDVKFVSTIDTHTSDFAFGFDQGVNSFLSGAARASRYPFNLGPGNVADNLLPGGDDDNIPLGATASPVVPGVLDFSATTLAIRLLKTDITAEVVQRPTFDHLGSQAGDHLRW